MGEYAQIESDLTTTNRVSVVICRRSIFAQRGRSSARLVKANLISESVTVRIRNSDPDSVCNQYASYLHIVAIRARYSIPHYARVRRVKINR